MPMFAADKKGTFSEPGGGGAHMVCMHACKYAASGPSNVMG